MTPESEEAIAIVVADFNMPRRLRIKGIAIVPIVWRGFRRGRAHGPIRSGGFGLIGPLPRTLDRACRLLSEVRLCHRIGD
jgi:hypothetical protein